MGLLGLVDLVGLVGLVCLLGLVGLVGLPDQWSEVPSRAKFGYFLAIKSDPKVLSMEI